LEARIGTQRIESRAYQNRRIESLCVSFFEPGECLILFVETYIDQRNAGCIGWPVIRRILQVI
jgi:hypothetical protein